jgi:HAD superfamily hydrolase (TIGR01509 family)
LGSGYTHWNPGDYLEEITGKKYDWESINNARQERIYADLSQAGLMPGAIDLLDYCRNLHLPLAVASSSSHRWVDGWLQKLGIADRFVSVLCRDDGLPVKPDPALYLETLKRLQLPATSCLVIEDSQNGTLAAARAGIPVIAISNRVTENADFSPATLRLSCLKDVISTLEAL